MASVVGFTHEQKQKIILRWMIEEYGTKLLTFFARVNCGDVTVKEIVHRIADLAQKMTASSTNQKIAFDTKSGPKTIALYVHDLKKAKECIDQNQEPTMDIFDITLLNKILKLADHNVKINNLLHINEKRNSWAHFSSKSLDFLTIFDQQRDILCQSSVEIRTIGNNNLKAVTKAEKREEIQKALQDLDVLDAELQQLDDYKDVTLNIDFRQAERYLRTAGVEILLKYYDELTNYNPLSFLFGISDQINVEKIYTKPKFLHKNNEVSCPLLEVLNIIQDFSENLVIEGPSGVGKSTFMRYLLSMKKSEQRFKDVFIIPFDCRSDSNTLDKVLSEIFAEATTKFTVDEMVSGVRSLMPLFLIDGLDERNPNSEKVVLEMLSWVKKRSASFVVLSRPGEHLRNFLNTIKHTNFEYVQLKGISGRNIKSIVEKYCDHFARVDTKLIKSEVSEIYHRIFGGDVTSPLIVCLITFLLIGDKGSVIGYTNSTELYENMFDALYNKLEERIRDKDPDGFFEELFEMNLDEFKERLFKFAFATLKQDQGFFSFEEIFPDMQSLPVDKLKFWKEALSAVCVSKAPFTRLGVARKLLYSFPHRSFQEFLAATHIADQKLDDIKKNSLEYIIGEQLFQNDRFKYFILGLLVVKKRLTQELSDEICSYIPKPFYNERPYDDLTYAREGCHAPEVIATLAADIVKVRVVRDFNAFNLILKRPCPQLEIVDLKLDKNNEVSRSILGLLKNLNVKVELTLAPNLKKHSEELLKLICGGRCKLISFKGRLTKRAAKLLPNLETLTLLLVTMDCLQPKDRNKQSRKKPVIQHMNINFPKEDQDPNSLVDPDEDFSAEQSDLEVFRWFVKAVKKNSFGERHFFTRQGVEKQLDQVQDVINQECSKFSISGVGPGLVYSPSSSD